MINIDNIKRKLLVKYPSFGSILANMNYVETTNCPTAGTDGDTVYYNPDFIDSLTEDEKTFVFAHEIAHVALDHIFRSEGKDKQIWNQAADAVINANLVHDGLPLIKGGIDIPEAINYDVETFYEILMQEKEKSNNQRNQSNSNNSQVSASNQNSLNDDSKQSDDVGHDTHDMWDDAIEKSKNHEQQNNNQTSSNTNNQKNNSNQNSSNDDSKQNSTSKQNDKNDKKKSSFIDKLFNRSKKEDSSKDTTELPKDNTEPNAKSKKEETIENLSKLGEKKTFKQNKIERKKQLEELKNSLAKQSTGAGISTYSSNIKIDDIGISTPLIDWRKHLRDAIKVNVDWSYKNATVEDGIVTPHLEKIPQPETEILLDTSGSIDELLLKNFLRECKNILKTSKVKVGCFDTKFYGFNEIKNINDIDNMEFVGRGGTNFDTAVNAFSRRVENKIIFTDGEASMPNKNINAIWVVFGRRRINPPGGKVIYITDEQLKELSNPNSSNYKR